MGKTQIQIHSESNYGGARFIDFSMDGKRYAALPKRGEEQSWLDEFKKLILLCSKFNLNPFATPLKSTPEVADGYKRMRMISRVKYSWNDDPTPKDGARSGLNKHIYVIAKDKLKDFLGSEEYAGEGEQLKMKLSCIINKLQDEGMSDTAHRVSAISKKLILR